MAEEVTADPIYDEISAVKTRRDITTEPNEAYHPVSLQPNEAYHPVSLQPNETDHPMSVQPNKAYQTNIMHIN